MASEGGGVVPSRMGFGVSPRYPLEIFGNINVRRRIVACKCTKNGSVKTRQRKYFDVWTAVLPLDFRMSVLQSELRTLKNPNYAPQINTA